jgi:hypothetical protein
MARQPSGDTEHGDYAHREDDEDDPGKDVVPAHDIVTS